MTTFTVKNIPPDLYKKLKKSADINRRSINSEIIVCIEKFVESQSIDSDKLLYNARKLRSHTANHPITNQEMTKMKDAGRP